MTAAQFDIVERRVLEHALGITQSGGRPYRKHYSAHRGTKEFVACLRLEISGFMRRAVRSQRGHCDIFVVTDAGQRAIESLGPSYDHQ